MFRNPAIEKVLANTYVKPCGKEHNKYVLFIIHPASKCPVAISIYSTVDTMQLVDLFT